MVKLSLILNLMIISSVICRNFKRGISKRDYRGFIIGGNSADIRRYPFQVSQRMKAKDHHYCGGSIISEKFVITAAHCLCFIEYPITYFYIWVGSSTLSGHGYRYDIESSICHSDHSQITLIHDIGLIGVKNKFVYRDTVKPISILLDEVPPGTTVTATGWGLTKYAEEEDIRPDHLQMVQVKVISLRKCKERFPPEDVLTNKQVCTFVKDRKAGTCAGDSGGPLTYHGHLVGLVSWGEPCAVGYPDVFTKVGAYKTWINDNINKYCRKWPCPKNVLPNYVKS